MREYLNEVEHISVLSSNAVLEHNDAERLENERRIRHEQERAEVARALQVTELENLALQNEERLREQEAAQRIEQERLEERLENERRIRHGQERAKVARALKLTELENLALQNEERLREQEAAQRIQQERLEAERLENEAERLENERLEALKIEQERLEALRIEKERLEQEAQRRTQSNRDEKQTVQRMDTLSYRQNSQIHGAGNNTPAQNADFRETKKRTFLEQFGDYNAAYDGKTLFQSLLNSLQTTLLFARKVQQSSQELAQAEKKARCSPKAEQKRMLAIERLIKQQRKLKKHGDKRDDTLPYFIEVKKLVDFIVTKQPTMCFACSLGEKDFCTDVEKHQKSLFGLSGPAWMCIEEQKEQTSNKKSWQNAASYVKQELMNQLKDLVHNEGDRVIDLTPKKKMSIESISPAKFLYLCLLSKNKQKLEQEKLLENKTVAMVNKFLDSFGDVRTQHEYKLNRAVQIVALFHTQQKKHQGILLLDMQGEFSHPYWTEIRKALKDKKEVQPTIKRVKNLLKK